MKVAHIINSLGTGGAEKLIVDSVPVYQDKGINIDVICLSKAKTPFFLELESRTQLPIKGLASTSTYNPLLIFKIIPYLKEYDIIHLHLFPTLYWVVLAKWISFSKVTLIYTEHNTSNRRRSVLVFKILDKFIYNKLNAIVCITHGVKRNLLNHIKSLKSIKVINNGIDTEKFFNAKGLKDYQFFEEDDFKIIQVSSFRKQKDQATLIRSLTLLPQKVKLLLVGDGPLIEESKKLVQTLNLTNRVLFLGNRYDVPELINYSDVTVLSSHWEGFGLAIVEGMAAKKPVIATNIDGIKEIVEGYGLLFNQGDDKELACLINKLKEDYEFYNLIAEKCFYRAKEFDINKMVSEYIELYDSVLNV